MTLYSGASLATSHLSLIAICNMFSNIARRYDLANHILSLGRDHFWRLALARHLKILTPPGRLLDLATGTGDQIVAAKKIWPTLAVTGLDLTPAMLELAVPKFKSIPPPVPEMIVDNILALSFDDQTFDSISISFALRNITQRRELYREVWRVLKPGGRFLVLEMFHDPKSPLAALTGLYLKKIVPFLGGHLVNREHEAYRYLTTSILTFPQPRELAAELTEAGFSALAGQIYTFNTVMLIWGERPK